MIICLKKQKIKFNCFNLKPKDRKRYQNSKIRVKVFKNETQEGNTDAKDNQNPWYRTL
jgi:hypothetical protein